MPSGNTKKIYRKRMFKKRPTWFTKKQPEQYKDIGTSKRIALLNGPLAVTQKAVMTWAYRAPLQLVSAGIDPVITILTLNGMWRPLDVINPPNPANTWQPRGFDELMALYDHFVVISVKVRIDCINQDTTEGALVFCTVKDNPVPFNAWYDYTESRNCQFKTLGVEASGASKTTLNVTLNPNKFLGRSKPLADPELKGSISNNPIEGAYLHVGAVNSTFTGSAVVQCLITMEFTAVFIEPKQPKAS